MRLIIASSALPSYLSKRNEISSPVTSFARRVFSAVHCMHEYVLRGQFARSSRGRFRCAQLGQDPYDGGSFHQSPLLLTLPFASNELVWVVYALADVCVAAALYAVAKRREHKKTSDRSSSASFSLGTSCLRADPAMQLLASSVRVGDLCIAKHARLHKRIDLCCHLRGIDRSVCFCCFHGALSVLTQ